MNMVILKTFDNALEASLLLSKLESRGIQCVLEDEYMVTTYPLFSNAIGGIKLKVAKKDLARSLEIIEESKSTPLTDEDDQTIACPNCGSTDFYLNFNSLNTWKGRLATLVPLIFGVYPISSEKVYRCKACQTEFKKDAQSNA